MLITLRPGICGSFLVAPRWPARSIQINTTVLDILQRLAAQLASKPDDSIQLIVTRGYEDPKSILGITRTILRFLGVSIFSYLYPARLKEGALEIFSPNGHDVYGYHVDLAFARDGERIALLPYGVFTPLFMIAEQEQENAELLSFVRDHLHGLGGTVHNNRVEALQMHVDFLRQSA